MSKNKDRHEYAWILIAIIVRIWQCCSQHPDKWVESYVHKDKWIFAVTLLGIPISQIRTSLSGTRHYETAQCPLKKHRQKAKVLSVTPMACHPFQQRFLSLALFVWSSTASTHVPNKDTRTLSPYLVVSTKMSQLLVQTSHILTLLRTYLISLQLAAGHRIIRSSTSFEQLPADPSVGCATWPTASSPYPPPKAACVETNRNGPHNIAS